ncbi:hypothetical protein P175DRAFT_0470219 [Aspergillus ochraceoroseus IBT 24754]|uniref:UDP-N-acetylglucosamine transferase subunit ALG13 n=3 Tax=Aspergillus subgen. Nidulantes TaxID=2720870 RepID=A0A0F8WP23_9EURO|nr:uncharacterized protein P175DRAFT_0470219 [Aspergillus ochraceoroseus IBT 24754]KKK19450.1 hypothetical protein ARAM_004144 [Aspergillus rambellii]KKK24142.1 hypothetical protein AOCH_003489 [Aspergillus ochraceoroseus]PTU24317.1 hypothetical protein P175DRAFT_0470219 [Aspergillus ochraceoroseus IBT 24754]
MTSNAQQPARLCFVTVGATASFHLLLQSILDPRFLKALNQFGYTNLLIQFGKDGQTLFDDFVRKFPPGDPNRHGVIVEGFDFNQAGLDREMRLAQSNPSKGRGGGLIISHAGSGSILAALRLGVPLLVVPNPTLQDNHQEELAHELQKQGYVVSSDYRELTSALDRVEKLRSHMLSWPPVLGPNQKRPPTLGQVMADELGFLD